MIYRILLFLLGLILATIGIMFSILFVSYLEPGYTINEFFQCVFGHLETYFIPIGIILMVLACFAKFKIFKKTII